MSTLINPVATNDILKKLEPVLRKHSAAGEAERTIAPEAAEAMIEAGVFRSLIPRSLGGLDLSAAEAFRLAEEIARIDGSAGWLAANQSGIATLVAFLPEEAADEIFADNRTMFAGALFPPGTAIPVDGGYRVTGRWPFGSGADYANWMLGSCVILDGGAPRMAPHGAPVLMMTVFRRDEAQVIDTWNTMGMRGTGSKDIAAEAVFVPERRTWIVDPGADPDLRFTSPINRLGFWVVAPVNAVVAMGIARAALDDIIALGSKTPAYLQSSLGDRSMAQDRIARAKAKLEAARYYVYGALEDACESVIGGGHLSPELGITLSLAGIYGMEAACEVVDLVHATAGTSAIRTEQRFQQYFRDVHTLTQHAYSSAARYESLGKLLLGRETDWAFYAG